jgi:hypothetical protein
MSSFAYSVAIKLSVANLASQGVRILANDLLKAHGAATNLQGKLSALKMVAVGYGLDRAGQGILGFMGKSIDASKEYTRQLSLMSAAGMGQKDIAEATAQAWKTSQSVITSSAAENPKQSANCVPCLACTTWARPMRSCRPCSAPRQFWKL